MQINYEGGVFISTDIFYFSGTGNSLFIARELNKRIPNSRLIPIVSLLNSHRILPQSRNVGIVFPEHALTIPIAVKKFLQKLELTNTEYIFAVATRGGTVFHGFKKIDSMLKKKKKKLDSQFIIDMYNNDSRHGTYKMPTKIELDSLEQDALRKLDEIENVVNNRGKHFEKIENHKIKTASNPVFSYLIEKMVLAGMYLSEHIGGVNYFYHDHKCTGCGICKKVCLSEKINIVDGMPVWNRNVFCYMCFACLNFCPSYAVQINDIPGVKSKTKENGRYPHPYASVDDILKQKTYCNFM